MPRPTMTPADRCAAINGAADTLSALIARATRVSAEQGWNAPAALKAWEAVEVNGATVHRQARLLAGKSRGG